jgi:dihydroxyacetone kinase
MAYIDKVKEEIGWLKIIFAISIATDISLIAWLVENFKKEDPFLLLIAGLGALLLMFVIIWINSVTYRKINKLEEL